MGIFRTINELIAGRVLGTLVHEYDQFKVKHGNATCEDRFFLRVKKGIPRLFHERVWQDPHDVKKSFTDHDAAEVERLGGVFRRAIECIRNEEAHDFGVFLDTKRKHSHERIEFSVELSNGTYYLFRTSHAGAWGSSNMTKLYFPLEEVEHIATVLEDAQQRVKQFTEHSPPH